MSPEMERVCKRTHLGYLIETGGRLQIKPGQDEAFRGHIPALDGVRGVAAATVFVYHYGGGAQSSLLPLRVAGTLIQFGWAGVSLFFVLSGFLISGILWDGYQKPKWWSRFYVRRSLRIFPLYYLAIAIAAAEWLVQGVPMSRLGPLWVYALYLGNVPWLGAELSHLPMNIRLHHFWSLAVEEQFYLVWPFVLALFAGKRLRAMHMILSLWLLTVAFRVVMLAVNGSDWSFEFLFGRGGELLAGAYLAMAVRGDAQERQRLFRILPYVLGCSLFMLLLTTYLSHSAEFGPLWGSTIGLAACSTFFACIVGLSLRPGGMQSAFQFPLLRWLGKISYGIYVYHLLFHNGFVWITDRIAPHAGANVRLGLLFVVALAGTLAVASLSFYIYESAFLRLKKRLDH
jgi:peptidoglycan/LPS O-acetylase OafA/YrhL